MPIRTPGRVLLRTIPLKFVNNRVVGHGRKAADASIILIPFIDFLIVLVVFLLSTFGQELLNQSPGLKMPDARNVTDLQEAPIISVNPDVVTLDGRRMADTRTLAASPQVERMEQLIQDLETLKRNWSILHPQQPFPGTVILQADRSIDFRVVKKCMFSAAQAGYANISFAVNRKAGAAAAARE